MIQDSTCPGFKSCERPIFQHCEAETGTPWAAIGSVGPRWSMDTLAPS